MRRLAIGVVMVLGSAMASAACGGGGGGTGGSASTTTKGTGGSGTGGSSGTHVVGDACTATSDCLSGLFCSTTDPGGQCLKVCAVAGDCPAGSVCTDEMKCYKSCTQASDCTRSGYACVDAMTVANTPTKTCDVAPAADAGTD